MRTVMKWGANQVPLIAASLIAAGGISFPALWVLAPLGLAAFFYLLFERTHSWRGALWGGFVFGFITSGAGIWWFWDTIPLDWLGIHNPVSQFYAVLATWSYINTFLAVPVAGVAVALWVLRHNFFLPFVAPLLWVLAEFGRMWGFAIATWGKESLMGPHFSAASIGYSLTESSYLLQLAYPYGIYALNFVTALIAMVLLGALALWRRRLSPMQVVPAGIFLLVLLSIPALVPARIPTHEEPLRVAIISTDLPAGVDDQEVMRDMLAQAAAGPKPDMVLMPEGHGLHGAYRQLTDDEIREELKKLFGEEETIVLHADARKAKILYESTTQGTFGTYNKLFLMPMGEYPPYFAGPFFSIIQDENLNIYAKTLGGGVTRGNALQPFTYKGITFGPLLCSDIISPALFDQLAKEHGATVLIGLANQAWFHHSQMLYDKTLQFAKTHAVAHRAYLLDSADGSPSFAIDPTGTVFAESEWFTNSVLFVDIP